MSALFAIRFNDDEEAVLKRQMAAYGDTKVGAHIKRVYFDATRPNDAHMNEIRDSLERLEGLVEGIQAAQQEGGAGQVDSNMLLSVVCGIYMMIHRTVGESVRAQADRTLDVAAIDGYLRGK